jgi:3-hydroxyacyl-CoA dehydrogenase
VDVKQAAARARDLVWAVRQGEGFRAQAAQVVQKHASRKDAKGRFRRDPVRLKKDATGHIANRLASALWREAVFMVQDGIADVEAIDAALVNGPGLRWSVLGAHMAYHLGGGAGGMAGYLAHLGPSQERRWATLGEPSLTPDVQTALVEGTARAAKGRSIAELEAARDKALIATLRARKDAPHI